MMDAFEISLNIMSLGGIALAVGMLMDNAIVALENIARHRETTPDMPLAEAVQRGTSEVAGAVVASALTTVAVFLPLAFVEGIAGELFRDQALTITFALVASLAFAFTLLPMLAALRSAPDPPTPGTTPDLRARRTFSAPFAALLGGAARLVRSIAAGASFVLRPVSWSFDRGLRPAVFGLRRAVAAGTPNSARQPCWWHWPVLPERWP